MEIKLSKYSLHQRMTNQTLKNGYVFVPLTTCHLVVYLQVTAWVAYYSRILSFFSDIYEVEKKDVPEHVARYSLTDQDTILFFYKGSAVYRLSEADISATMSSKDFFDTTFEIMSKVLQPRRWRAEGFRYVPLISGQDHAHQVACYNY